MVEVLVGDLFDSSLQTLTNPVNCVGVMGKGLAFAYRQRFPEMYEDYIVRCREHSVHIGQPYLFRPANLAWILNFPTKDHWREKSQIAHIVEGLAYLKLHYREWGIISLAIPALGCGEGKLSWSLVGPLLYQALLDFHVPIELYAPQGTAVAMLSKQFLAKNQSV